MKTRLYISASAFVLAYGAVAMVAKRHLGPAAGIAATVAAVVCFGWFMIEEVSALRCLDELQRRIQLEALAIAFPALILLLVGLGSLQRFMALSPDDWSYRHVWPFSVLFYFIGLLIAKARYR
jgi:hypothetical protein